MILYDILNIPYNLYRISYNCNHSIETGYTAPKTSGWYIDPKTHR